MAHEKKHTGLIITVLVILGILIAVGGFFGYKAWQKNKQSPYEFIQKKGATYFKSDKGEEGYRSGRYQFYSNNRVSNTVEKKMGTYDKEKIKWDDGSETGLDKIFV